MTKKLIALAAASVLLFALSSICFAKPELSVNGWYRVRGHFYQDIDLDKDTGGAGEKERSFWEQKFVINPSLKITDNITILARLRALDMVWGYNHMPYGLTFESPVLPGGERNPDDPNANFTWDRLWANITLGKYGTFMIGRQNTNLFHNYFVSDEDTYGRVNWMIWPVPDKVLAGFLYDKRGEDNIDDMNDGEATHWCPWFMIFEKNWTFGYVHSWFIYYTPTGRGNAHFNDAMFNAKIGTIPIELKSEFTYTFGTAAPGVDITDSFSMFADFSVPLEGPVNKVSLLFSYFQGYKEDTQVSWSGVLGSNVDWVDDWEVDLILFNQILGRVINAMVIRPRVDITFPGAEKWGAYVSCLYAMADQNAEHQPYYVKDTRVAPGWGALPVNNGTGVVLTDGTDKDMGFEVDVGIKYALAENSDVVLGIGYFAPGKYFVGEDPCLGFRLKTMVRF